MQDPNAEGRSLQHRWRDVRIDVFILIFVIAVTAVPRLVLLADVPPGLHGDESVTAALADEILEDGHIGVYAHEIGGSPTGMFYWTAAVFSITGDSPFTVRLSFALLGIATVGMTFLAFRVMFDRPTATIAALLLAVFAWHLHYSRIALIPIGMPFTEMATVLLLFLALRYQSKLLFGATGAALAAGLYTYKAFPVFALGFAAVLLWLAVFHYRHQLLTFVSDMAVLFGVALLVGAPMASFAWDDPEAYKSQGGYTSVTETEKYQDADNAFEQGLVLVQREVDFLRSFVDEPMQRDGVDAAGIMPFLNRIWLGLVIVGGAIALWRIRRPEYAAVLILIATFAVLPVWQDGAWYRRTLPATPFLALVAALPLAFVWHEARQFGTRGLVVAGLSIALVIAGSASLDFTRYFTTYDDHEYPRYVLKADVFAAYDFMNDLPEGTFVYFFSRYGLDGEDHYLVENFAGTNWPGEVRALDELGPDRSRDQAFVFTDNSIDLAEEVERRFPGGQRIDGGDLYQAYLLPRSADAAENP